MVGSAVSVEMEPLGRVHSEASRASAALGLLLFIGQDEEGSDGAAREVGGERAGEREVLGHKDEVTRGV